MYLVSVYLLFICFLIGFYDWDWIILLKISKIITDYGIAIGTVASIGV